MSTQEIFKEHWRIAYSYTEADKKEYWTTVNTCFVKVADRIVPNEEMDELLYKLKTWSTSITINPVDPLATFRDMTLDPGCTYLEFRTAGFYRRSENKPELLFQQVAKRQFADLGYYAIETLKSRE